VQAPLGHTHASVSKDDDWKAEKCQESEQEDQEAEAFLAGRQELVVAVELVADGVLCAR